jgi:hypothetical protein
VAAAPAAAASPVPRCRVRRPPISVPSGRGIYAVGMFEVEYLYAHPRYVWEFAGSQPDGAASGLYCSYR